MNNRSRIVRFAAALAVAGVVASQIPSTGSAAFAQGFYVTPKMGGNFLGIKGLETRDVMTGAIVALAAYGIYSVTQNGKGDEPAAGGNPPAPASPAPVNPAPATPAPAGGESARAAPPQRGARPSVTTPAASRPPSLRTASPPPGAQAGSAVPPPDQT